MSASGETRERLVNEHLHLVRGHLAHHVRLPRQPSRFGDYDDLYQEGVVALIEAAGSYQPQRHGSFVGYAQARIHYAISHFLYEGFRAVRIPATIQKMRRGKRQVDQQQMIPKEVAMGWPDEMTYNSEHWRHRPERPTLGDVWCERYRAAVNEVRRRLKQSPGCKADRAELVDRFAEERLLVPEPSARTAKRELARQMDCSVGRINGLERRFRKELMQWLDEDDQAKALWQRARSTDDGWRECISDPE